MNGSIEEDLLRQKHGELLIEYTPLIIFMTLMGIIGVIGNIVTLLVYRRMKASSVTVFIVGLAAVDLIVCCLSFASVANAIVNVMFMDKFLCKLRYFLNQWSVMSSGHILWIISIDRFWKMCRPSWKQFSVFGAMKGLAICIGFAFVMSLRNLVLYDINQLPLTEEGMGINGSKSHFVGYICYSTNAPGLRSVVLAFNMADVIIASGVLVTFVVSYGSIIRTLKTHQQTMIKAGISVKKGTIDISDKPGERSVQSSTDDQLSDTRGDEDDATTDTAAGRFQINDTSVDAIEDVDTGGQHAGSTDTPERRNGHGKQARVKRRSRRLPSMKQSERNITLMLFAITIAFLVCCIPYFVSVGIIATSPVIMELNPLIQCLRRSIYWNSVVNPIFFYIFNRRYRLYVKDIFRCFR